MRQLVGFLFVVAVSGLGLTAPTRAQQEEAERIRQATTVLKELKDSGWLEQEGKRYIVRIDED